MQIGYHCAHLHVHVNGLPLWNWEKLPVTWKLSATLVALARVAVCHQSLWGALLMTQSGNTDSDSASQYWIQLISQTLLITPGWLRVFFFKDKRPLQGSAVGHPEKI